MITRTVHLSEIDQVLEDLLNSLSPAQTRKAMQSIAKYLRERNLYRITAQQDATGKHYPPRKDKAVHRKMLLGFRRYVKAKMDIVSVEIGIFGNSARLANVHHYGQTEKGIRYPARPLVTLADADKDQIRQMLLSLLAAR